MICVFFDLLKLFFSSDCVYENGMIIFIIFCFGLLDFWLIYILFLIDFLFIEHYFIKSYCFEFCVGSAGLLYNFFCIILKLVATKCKTDHGLITSCLRLVRLLLLLFIECKLVICLLLRCILVNIFHKCVKWIIGNSNLIVLRLYEILFLIITRLFIIFCAGEDILVGKFRLY